MRNDSVATAPTPPATQPAPSTPPAPHRRLHAAWAAALLGALVLPVAAALAWAPAALHEQTLVAGAASGALLAAALGLAWHHATRAARHAAQAEAEACRAQRLQAALQQLRRPAAAGELCRVAAHDVNNLLMLVATTAQVLRKQQAATDIERAAGALERAVANGGQLTRRLTAFAQREPAPPQALDLRQRLPELGELLRLALGGRIRLVAAPPPQALLLRVDEGELELALLALAFRARDAMAEGGQLRLGVEAAELDDGTPCAEITFDDDGSAPAGDSASGGTTAEGTGLGLDAVQAFAQAQGGALQVEHVAGVGSSVTLRLPLAVSVAEATLPATAAEAGGRRALLVDDDAGRVHAAATLLRAEGYRVDCVSSGDDALARLLTDDGADLVLASLSLPGPVDALAMARALQREAPQLAVLLHGDDSEQRAAAQRAGWAAVPLAAPAVREAVRALAPQALRRVA